MFRHPDPQVQWFAQKLERAKSDIGQVKVTKGSSTNRRVGHLVVERKIEIQIPKIDFLGTPAKTAKHLNRFEVYFSKSAVELSSLADSLSVSGDIDAIFLVEVENPKDRDLTSGRYFNILRKPGYSQSDFESDSLFFSGVLGRALEVNRDGYKDLVSEIFSGKSHGTLVVSLNRLTDKATLYLIDKLKPIVGEVKKIFSDGTMPRELWDPDSVPDDFKMLISKLGGKLDEATNKKLELLGKIPRLSVVATIRKWPGSSLISSLLSYIEWIENTWNDALDLLGEIIKFIRKNNPQSADVIGTTIGFLCGLWDGIIQAVEGIFETVQLGLTLLQGSIRARQDPVATGRFILEVFDEVIQILSRVKWRKVWNLIKDEIGPQLIKLFDASLESLSDTVARSPATVGYYAGFVVYNIAEIFFPPLKITGAARAAKAADLVADVSGKVVPK